MNFSSKQMRAFFLAGTLVCIFVFAAYLRFRGIDSRPMHTDEAVQAFKVGEMLAGETYRYSPTDFHGPTLYFFAFWLCKIFGVSSFAEMSETLLRSVPAVVGAFGCVAIPLAFFGRKILPVFIAGTLLSCSSLAILYDSYFIQETLLSVFAWLAAGIFFFRKKTLLNAVLAGTFAGLAIASKETWVLMAFAFLMARSGSLVFEMREKRLQNERAKILGTKIKIPEAIPWKNCSHKKRLLGFLIPAMIIAVLFYSSFGRNFHGLFDFFQAFPHYMSKAANPVLPAATNAQTIFQGYTECVYFFVNSFLYCGILVIVLLPISLFIKAKSGIKFPPANQKPIAFFAISTLVLASIYFKMPYNMPWLYLGVIPGTALLIAAFSISIFRKKGQTILVFATIVWAIISCALRLENAHELRHEHPSARVPEISKIVEKAKADFIARGGNADDFFVAIVCREYWPIPWYLRRERFGYWDCDGNSNAWKNAPVIITDFKFEPENFLPLFEFELRPEIILAVRENGVPAHKVP